MPQGWQGALPFRYHLGPGGVRVHLVSQQDYQRRIIWDVIGKVKGSEFPDDWVIVGNHRDAWVYGAVDPNSGTAAMLEAVHGIGALLQQGWRPKRTIVFCSWDAEEEGLIGSTEWVEQHAKPLEHAVAYFNTDVAVSGPDFTACRRSLAQAVRPRTHPLRSQPPGRHRLSAVARQSATEPTSTAPPTLRPARRRGPRRRPRLRLRLHALPPARRRALHRHRLRRPLRRLSLRLRQLRLVHQNADPHFVYLQEMARVFGLEALRMADADVLPYDYVAYAREIASYLDAAKRKAADNGLVSLDFASGPSRRRPTSPPPPPTPTACKSPHPAISPS